MQIEELLATKRQLNANVTESSARLAAWAYDKRGAMGSLNDNAKQSNEYKVLNAQYNYDFEELRQFNKSMSKNKEYQKALRAEQMAKRYNKAVV